MVIDWAIGSRGNSLACHARPWLITQLCLDPVADAPVRAAVQSFWSAYLDRYRELRPYSEEELRGWQAVVAAVSLAWEGARMPVEPRVSLVEAVLNDKAHPWLG